MKGRWWGCLDACDWICVCGMLLFGMMTSHSFGQESSVVSTHTASGKQETIHWFNTYEAALHQAQVQKKPLLILFTGTAWCPACKKLEKEVLVQPHFAAQVANAFVFLKADFRTHSGDKFLASPFYELLEKYKVQYFPTFVGVDQKGDELFRVDYQSGGVDVYVKELLQGARAAS